jgi:tape measure domain-containing protein
MAKAIETLSIKLEFKDAGTQQIINKLNSSFKGLERVISGNTKPAIQKLRSEINTFAATGNKSISTIESQVTALRALRREADINSKEFKQLTADISKYEKQLGKAQGRRSGRGGRALAATQMAGAAISGGIFGGPEGFGGAVLGGAIGGVPGSFAGAAIGAQVGMIRQSLGGVAETVAEINSMKIALAGVSESAEDYRQSFNSVIEISKQFLFPVDKAIGEFTRLKAAVVGAGFGTKEATDVFKGFAAAILATGGNSEKLSGALLAASQVFSKGKVQAEELRGQIGERLPGAFTTFAQSIGVSSRDLDEMLRKGEVSTENFVEFTRTLFSRYEKTAETLGSSPEKAGQRLQLALSLATLEYGGFFQKVGAGFQDYLANLVNFVTENKKNFIKIVANVAAFSQDIVAQVKSAAMNIATPFILAFSALEVKIENLQQQFGLLLEAAKAFGRLVLRADGFDGFDLPPSGRPSVEERATAIRGQLEGLFAQFDPTSFGTSLGDKPLPGGEDQDTGDGTDTKSTLARRIKQAQQLEMRTAAQLRLAQSQGQIAQLLARQASERIQLESRLNELIGDGTNEKINQAAAAARSNLEAKQEFQLQSKIKALYEQAKAPLDAIVQRIKDKVDGDKMYKRLIAEGVNPELAKELVNINKAYEAGVRKLEVQIENLEATKLEAELNGKIVEGIEDQIDALKRKKKELEGEKKEAEGTAKENIKPQTFMEGLDQAIEDQEDKLKKLIDPLNQVKEAANAIGEAFKTSFRGIIDGSMTAREALANFFQSIADHFADMAAEIAAEAVKLAALKFVQMIVSSFTTPQIGSGTGAPVPGATAPNGQPYFGPAFAQGGYVQGGFRAFSQGGVVSKPTLGMVGEGGEPEYIIPASKMRESMARYSRGARGSAVIPENSGGGTVGEGGGAAVAAPIDVRYTVERINNVDYVTADQFQAGMRQAANQGAKQGEQQTLKRLQMSGSTRKRLGM